jgi:hypothetical protein
MRSDDELDKETDRFVTRLWILGIIIMLAAGVGVFAAIKYKVNQDHIQEKLDSYTCKEEVPIDKLKIKAEILRHNFPLEHPKYHVEKKDGAEYWFCDDEHCSMYLVISDDLQIMSSGYPQMTECNKHLFVEE